jgi:putative iron-dependent peroxidase
MSSTSSSSSSRSYQPVIVAPVPLLGCHLVFGARVGTDPRPALARLRTLLSPESAIVGLGQPLVLALGAKVPGLRAFPALCGPGIAFPSTQGWLWIFLIGSDAGDLHDRARAVRAAVCEPGGGFSLRDEAATFQYRKGRDLTGFEDGTENPKDERALAAAIVSGRGDALDGSSFAAIQRYVHDLDGFGRLSSAAKEAVIGRSLETNEELADAHASVHVKRTAQESFDPEAFIVRRAMPWGGATESGSYFVAYGESLDRFERLLTRMAGLEDGIVDALLGISRPVSGGYYWCPPTRDGRLHLAALGL